MVSPQGRIIQPKGIGASRQSLDVGLGERPKRVDLADIMYQSEQSPLYIHFHFGP